MWQGITEVFELEHDVNAKRTENCSELTPLWATGEAALNARD